MHGLAPARVCMCVYGYMYAYGAVGVRMWVSVVPRWRPGRVVGLLLPTASTSIYSFCFFFFFFVSRYVPSPPIFFAWAGRR
eukprot:NODE_7784_length_385_cov_45.425595_g6087_i0.p2 GENE.NODE_7784_length_385_cov_45.425595_g6087_i0~~NODE_7784_length_385_cov_45.425595_g6087_i0.p2  ORF type:complete len:81 (+),score=7.36 NODE_7784_length_385_cov_45.425595_g6087_i0:70-312(+)